MEKTSLHSNAFSFDPIFVKLAGNEDRYKISARSDYSLRSVQFPIDL